MNYFKKPGVGLRGHKILYIGVSGHENFARF